MPQQRSQPLKHEGLVSDLTPPLPELVKQQEATTPKECRVEKEETVEAQVISLDWLVHRGPEPGPRPDTRVCSSSAQFVADQRACPPHRGRLCRRTETAEVSTV